MMRRVIVERNHWVTLREFTEAYALSQLSPGIHFIALAGLLGRAIAGPWGVVVSVAGMMVPAALITALMTAFYSTVAEHPLAIAAVSGMGPIAAGMTIGLAIGLVKPMLRRGRYAVIDVAVVLAAFGVLLLGIANSVVVILCAGAIGAVLLRGQRPTSADATMS